MNARILRKWRIHTKNLMSCSVCSLVVVVLLLLVTCAPTLILATMNFRSDASFAANPPHMPKHAIKEATLSSLFSSLPNTKHRLASSNGVEVVKTVDTDRESFPDYYKNFHTDDTQPLSPHQAGGTSGGSSSSNSYSARNRESMSANIRNRHKIIENKQQLHDSNDNLGYMLQLRGWSRHHTSPPTPTRVPLANDDSSFNDGIKQSSYIDKADGFNDEYETVKYKDSSGRTFLYVRNGQVPPQTTSNLMDSYSAATAAATTTSYKNRNFPVQPHSNINNRRIEDRTHHVAPSPLTLHITTPTKTFSQPKRTSRTASVAAAASAAAASSAASTSTSAHIKQPELIYSNNLRNVKNIFSTTHNKSMLPVPVPVPVSKEDNVFGIDNSNVNKIKSSGLPLRFIIESYEVPASLPFTKELTEQQRRMLIHEQHLKQLRTMQQQAARSRRESLRGRYKKYENGLLTTSSSSSSSSLTSSAAATNFRMSPALHNLRQHQHQQSMRKHSRRYCSARDPAQLAFEAPTVFEGKIVSMTPDRRQNFSATVEVRDVFKQQIGYRLQKYLRLQFAYRNNSGECDIYREELRPRGLVRGDTIEPGRLYLLFVQQIDIGNFTILGQPIRKTKRVVEAVRYAVSGNYAQLASIKSISASNRSVENGQELRIVCKVTGRPPPKVTWFKDHRSINRNRKLYQFSHYKKRSELIIRSFNTSDAGRYECRAKNKVNRNIERRAIVIKAYPVQRFDPNPRGAGNNCPDDASEFCFNGGTCKFFSEIGSYSCICPEGFIGERCDRKEVNNVPPSTYSNEHECGENKYLGSYYC